MNLISKEHIQHINVFEYNLVFFIFIIKWQKSGKYHVYILIYFITSSFMESNYNEITESLKLYVFFKLFQLVCECIKIIIYYYSIFGTFV